MNQVLCGVINVNKEKDYTSHDVVAIIRNTLHRVKTGHTGTLDPMATGVLPVCVGKATKISEYLASETKGYRATLNLGFTTDTQDEHGEILTQTKMNASKPEIEKAIYSFIGEQQQLPPMYSAIKINGQKLYDIARQGKVIEREPRKITIHEIKIIEFLEKNKIVIDILCSKGTYVRTLCHDIGQILGCGGNMGDLIRTRSGNFFIEHSHYLAEIKEMAAMGSIEDILVPVDKVLVRKKVYVKDTVNKYLYNGNQINLDMVHSPENLVLNEEVYALDEDSRIIGLYKVLSDGDSEYIKPAVMLI